MKHLIYSILLLMVMQTAQSQQTFQGIFRLKGIQDMASGFRFMPDGTFQFFMIYGAVDRQASGTYSLHGDTIKLTSNKQPGNDFEILQQDIKGNTYKVVVRDENSYLTQTVKAIVYFGNNRKEFEANSEGVIDIATKNCEKIYLQHELYSDIATLIKDELNANTYFEVKLKPSLSEVSFKGIDLFRDGDTLRCHANYLMPFENIRFVKEK